MPGEIFPQFLVLKEDKFTIKIRSGAEQAGTEPVCIAVKIDGQVVGELKVSAKAKSLAALTCSAALTPGGKHLSLIFLNPVTEPAADPKADVKVNGPPKQASVKPKDSSVRAPTRSRWKTSKSPARQASP